jgi:hypothetical protein
LDRLEKVRGIPSYLKIGTMVGDKSYQNIFGLHGLGRRNQFKYSSTFVKEMELSLPTHGLKSPRDDLHMESIRRWNSTPVGLSTHEASIQIRHEAGCADTDCSRC